MASTDDDARLAALWRIEAPKIIATVARIVRDIGVAEEIVQAAFVAALEHWPKEGVPDKPGAWLTTTAKHRALDHVRREKMRVEKHDAMANESDTGDDDERERSDDVLRLLFVACHPVLAPDARIALTLRVVAGLTTTEIARAFLSTETTIQQRIVRAKKTLSDAHVAFELPAADEMNARLASVMQVVYLVFNEGYAATAGDDWMRPALCDDALRLGRMLAARAPGEAEVHGLVALMELQASRTRARTTSTGAPVLLDDQDRTRWNRAQIHRGLQALARADAIVRAHGDDVHGEQRVHEEHGPYALQAAIAACHATALEAAKTDWARIASLYADLARVAPSPIVELNRAVAVSRATGAAAALPIVDALVDDGALDGYALLYAVRADLLAKLGRTKDARKDLAKAVSLTDNARERAMLEERSRSL